MYCKCTHLSPATTKRGAGCRLGRKAHCRLQKHQLPMRTKARHCSVIAVHSGAHHLFRKLGTRTPTMQRQRHDPPKHTRRIVQRHDAGAVPSEDAGRRDIHVAGSCVPSPRVVFDNHTRVGHQPPRRPHPIHNRVQHAVV